MPRLKTATQTAKGNKLLIKIIVSGVAFIAVTLYRNMGNDMKVVGHIVEGANEPFSYREVMERVGRAVTEQNGISNLAKEVSDSFFTSVWKMDEVTTPPAGTGAEETQTAPQTPEETLPAVEPTGAMGNLEPDGGTDYSSLASGEETHEFANLVFNPMEFTDTTDPGPFEIPLPDNVIGDEVTLGFKYATPLKGNVTSPFQYRVHPIDGETKFHFGIDIGAEKGTSVLAFAAGTVSEAGWNSAYGNYVKILHANGYTSMYGHCSKLYVKKGDKVKLGQKISAVGMTGLATGPHLHFELRNGVKFYDPTYYINP
jgi:murein DD-endopeptidase MepM/ murein hydrolase activator NlpD